jgi:hypothetical protein
MAPYLSKRAGIKSPRAKKLIVILIAVLMLIGIPIFVLERTNTINLIQDGTNVPSEEDGINYGPPTEEDKKSTEDHKDDIVKNQDSQGQSGNNGSSTTKKAVKPVIGSVSSTDVRTIIPEVIENGGTCTATFTRAGQATVTKSATAVANAQNTICNVSFSGTPVGTGWKVTVLYQSSTSEGTSDAADIP